MALGDCGSTSGYFEMLDNYTIRYILHLNHLVLMCRAREACKLFAALLERPGSQKANNLLEEGSKAGDKDVCRLAKQCGATDFLSMLYCTASNGHDGVCRLAKEWGITNYFGMLGAAAEGGHEGVCRLAKEWGATNFDWMLVNAAREGHEGLCRLAKEWGANDLPTAKNHLAIMK